MFELLPPPETAYEGVGMDRGDEQWGMENSLLFKYMFEFLKKKNQ